MKYIKKLILLILFLLAYNVQAQHILSGNYVFNSSFEEYFQCPFSNMQINFAKKWSDGKGGLGSSDYFNTCSQVLINYIYIQQPKTGNGMAAIVMYGFSTTNNYREYIMGELSDSLKKSKRICGCFFTSLFNYSNGAINEIGINFSKDSITYTGNLIPLSYLQPQIENKKGIIIDTINWVKICGTFIAIGGERFITIGNFRENNNTNYNSLNYGTYAPYYFIDDVSVCECSFDINLGHDTSLCEGESLILMPNLPNASYTWQDSSHAATYEVKQSGTYWVRAYVADYDITTTDTIVITYKDCSNTIPDLRIPDSFTPNGDGLNDKFEYFYAEYYDITTLIYNRWGQLLFQSQNTDFWDGKYKGKTVHPGTYIYHIEAIRKDTKEKKIHCGRITIL
jgi:gliding motility-associated-like protein